jgi:S1-C subfamily serine protease
VDPAAPTRKRPPDWIVYGGLVLAFVALAVSEQERADAPAAPPPVQESAAALVAGAPINAAAVKPVPARASDTRVGTAFSISDKGVWLAARHVVAGCRQTAVIVAPGRGVLAQVTLDSANDVAVLITAGGAPPLPLALDQPLSEGQRAYHPGFPQGRPGEAATRLLGRDSLRSPARASRPQPVLAWAEVGRTDGLKGSLAGLSGAPVLDPAGRVVGVTLAESPRRGRIYAAPPEAIRAALAHAHASPSGFAQGQPITTDNYGRVADGLRRDLRVAQVACLR